MSRVRLLFSEAWSSITANISTTFAATMTVLIGMFLLGLFIALGSWVLSWSDHVKSELQIKVLSNRADLVSGGDALVDVRHYTIGPVAGDAGGRTYDAWDAKIIAFDRP